MKYLVIRYEEQTYRYEYEVDADTKEAAEEIVRSEDCEPVRQKLVNSETVDIESEELKED